MAQKKTIKRLKSIMLSAVMVLMLVFSNLNVSMFENTAKADTLPVKQLGAGSIGVGSNEAEAAKLPRTNTQETYRFTTENYNNNNEALDTNDWASNFLWDLEGDRYSDSTGALSGTAYAFPLYYLVKKDGLRVSKASMTSNESNVSAYYVKDNDTLGDFIIYPEWTITNNNIDESTDWSYKTVSSNSNNSSQMITTMTQGSPFAYVELKNSNVFNYKKCRATEPSALVYSGTYDNCVMYVFRTRDTVSSVNGYPSATYQYYALYLPAGSNVQYTGTDDFTVVNDGIGINKVTLPSDKTYFSFAWLDESRDINDDVALNYAKEYRPYAFNFITDTRADYSYNESTSTLTTTYKYTVEKKSGSTADGTIMGLLPHQYKYMSNYDTMGNDAITLRGMMKFMKGSSYTTNMTYKGILPFMPELSENDTAGKAQLQTYVDQFMDTYMSGSGDWTLAKDEGHETYYHGKKLNRSAQVIAAAKSLGDEESATKVLEGLEANLEDWFTYSGSKDKHYFTYLGEGVGVLLGFPTSFNAVDQFNDHHFHYGYFIQSAACVGLWDKEWLNEYKDVVKQLVYDIASPYRNQEDCVADCGNAYPYLRSFAPYEGHSWASGYEDERTGNNQESTSEAINAWAGIILLGEMLGDDEIRDLGIYLYTTEVAAADNYWFDIDEDIYKIDDSKYEAPMASMVWGGKADYSTWFGKEYTQGIQICPMQSWSFYLLNGGADYIKKFYEFDKTSSLASGGSTSLWNDMWAAYYALADPQTAMNSVWTKNAINDGESQAHTYHYIQSLIDYGTPDISYTSDSTMSSVFTKNGVQTFAVYNSDSTAKTVTFTDGSGKKTQVLAAPNKMTLLSSEDAGKPTYTVEYYAKDLNSNNYSLIDTTIKYANAGSSVTADAKAITGYTFESGNSNNKLTGTVNSDGSLVLKVYYTRATYSISYNLNGGNRVDNSKYPTSYTYGETYELDSPTREGYDFYGWYAESTLKTKVDSIEAKTNGNLTLYAKWVPKGTILVNEDVYLTFDTDAKGTFTIIGDSEYNAVNVLYKIVNSESEAAQLAGDKAEEGFVAWGLDRTASGWTRTENFSANTGKYIVFYFIRYDNAGGYKTDYGYGKITAGFTDTEPEPTVAETTQKQDETTQKPAETTPSTPSTWTVVDASGDQYYYGNANNITVVNVQQPGWASEAGVYANTSAGVEYVTINGVRATSSQVAIDGAGAVVYLSAISTEATPICYYSADGTLLGSVVYKKTQEETTTEAPTTVEETETSSTTKLAAPLGLTYAGNEVLPYYFAWQVVEGAESYNFYVNGVLVDTGIVGGSYNADASAFPTSGEYTIGVTAVKGGVESDMTTTTKSFEVESEIPVETTTEDMMETMPVETTTEEIIETTTEEVTTEEQTEAPTEEPTEAPTPADPSNIVISDDVQIEGYQISSTKEGSRVVGSVEPTINGLNVEKWGLIYAIEQVGDSVFSVPDEEMYVGVDNAYITSFESTEIGTSNVVLGESTTATYFVRTMLFSAKNEIEFSARYKVRAYAVLSDGSYVYSDVSTYSVFDICDKLYQNKLMNTYDAHQYLYNNILTVVDPTYKEVDYAWGNVVVKPGNVN